MQVICISRGSYIRGKEFAERLAAKLGYQCISREEILEEANRHGIPVGRLEMAMIKPQYLTERLLLAKDHYLSLVTSFLCERGLKSNIVYHGRTGHLVLGGIRHVLRIRVVCDMEYRIQNVMQRLNLSREKAKKYIEEVEVSRKRWVKLFYNVDWELAANYDVVLNLEQMGVDNSATALCCLAQLPDFQETPSSHRVMEDLLLASNARLVLAEDEHTCDMQLKVRANNGIVGISYLPQESRKADFIQTVLRKLNGIRELHCTMARTSILWIQERFDSTHEYLHSLLEIAEKWDAAIELLRFIPLDERQETKTSDKKELYPDQSFERTELPARRLNQHNGGIEDDIEEKTLCDADVKETLQELIKVGRAGGCNSLKASPKNILNGIDLSIQHSLVVLDNLFLSKDVHTQKRLCRELGSYLSDHMKCPVVRADELREHYLFSKKQLFQMLFLFLIAIGSFALIMANQTAFLRFMTNETFPIRMLAVFATIVFVPFFTYIYGTFSHQLCKLLKLE